MSSVWAAAAARATGQCRSISGVVRHLDTCCDFLRRVVLLRRFVLPARRRGGLELGGHICHPVLFLCRLGSMQTLHSPHRFGRPLNICREAALPPANKGVHERKDAAGHGAVWRGIRSTDFAGFAPSLPHTQGMQYKQPAPSHHRPPSLSRTMRRRDHWHGPITVSRQSKLGHAAATPR